MANEHLIEPTAGKPAAVVVKMPLFAPNRKEADVRAQIGAAFPGVPIIFVDQGTEIALIPGSSTADPSEELVNKVQKRIQDFEMRNR